MFIRWRAGRASSGGWLPLGVDYLVSLIGWGKPIRARCLLGVGAHAGGRQLPRLRSCARPLGRSRMSSALFVFRAPF